MNAIWADAGNDFAGRSIIVYTCAEIDQGAWGQQLISQAMYQICTIIVPLQLAVIDSAVQTGEVAASPPPRLGCGKPVHGSFR